MSTALVFVVVAVAWTPGGCLTPTWPLMPQRRSVTLGVFATATTVNNSPIDHSLVLVVRAHSTVTSCDARAA